MKALELINKTREYIDYIEEHINNVEKAWKEVKIKCKDMRFIWDDFYYFHLDNAIKYHDISKLSEQEFVQYRKDFFPIEEEPKFDAIEAIDHHKRHNFHHWERWTKDGNNTPNEWEIHCAHMVIDWMAMGYKFNDTAQSYYERNKDKIILPDYAKSFIYEIFSRIES